MVFHRENYDTQVSRKLKNYENWPNLMTEIRGLLAYILIQTHTHTNIYIYIYTECPKTYITNFSWLFPTPN